MSINQNSFSIGGLRNFTLFIYVLDKSLSPTVSGLGLGVSLTGDMDETDS